MHRHALALSLVLGCVASTAFAEEAPAPLAPITSTAPLPAAPTPQVIRAHRSPGMMVAGIVLTSIGTAALVAGAAGAGVASTASSDDAQITGAITGLVLIPASILFAAVGIPLWVIGAKAPTATATSSSTAPALRWTF